MTPQATRSARTKKKNPIPTHHGTPVANLARSLAHELAFPADWLRWPPDMFAFTSAVLRQTGCYRYVLDQSFQRDVTWQARIERCADRWLGLVDEIVTAWFDGRAAKVAFPNDVEPLCGAIGDLETLAPAVTMEDLRTLHTEDGRRLARALITIHAVADEACTSFGMLGRFARRKRREDANDIGSHTICLANFLLTAYGSLSTLCKHHGIVLPKMRTPQSGLSLRSLSHQVMYHTSEVEVMWRTMPWASVEENTINILLVP